MPAERPLVLVDLDDTLFQTRRHMAPDAPGQVAALDLSGAPICFMSPLQHTFVSWLLDSADVVPVTARSVDAFRRVQIPFTGPAVCSNGAVLLDREGRIDAEWDRAMRSDLAALQEVMHGLVARLLDLAAPLGIDLRTWAVIEEGLATYVVVKVEEDEAGLARFAAGLAERLGLEGFLVHRNGRNLALLPAAISKRRAAEEIVRRDRAAVGERPVLGFGDSLSDLEFMDACHWWATPRKGQIARWLHAARAGDLGQEG